MGNSASRVVGCFVPLGNGKEGVDLEFLEPLDEGLGHSFCYVRPVIVDSPAITPSNSERYTVYSTTLDSETYSGSFRQEIVEDLTGLQRVNKNFAETTFKTISGASVSANASTARTGNLNMLLLGDAQEPAASFESTASFAALPLQPVPRGSGPLNGFMSGPLERGFASGPLERGAGFMSGPLDKGAFTSGPLESTDWGNFSAPLAYGQRRPGFGRLMKSMSRPMKSAFSRAFTRCSQGRGWMQRFLFHPMTQLVWHSKGAKFRTEAPQNCLEVGPSCNLQWAHGKAGEDRVHVVLSEEQGWLFIGIYDGFSGPDAPDFLMSSLYKSIDKELEGLLWDYEDKPGKSVPSSGLIESDVVGVLSDFVKEECGGPQLHNDDLEKQGENPSQAHDECSKNWCNEGVAPIQSKENAIGTEPTVEKGSGDGLLETDEIVEEKDGSKDVHQLQRETIQDCGADLGDVNSETESPVDSPESKASFPATKLASKCRKRKQLYELLQMELLEEYGLKEPQLASEVGKKRSSWDLQSSASEDLNTRESLPTAQAVLCSSCIKGESSGHVEDDGSLRESEGILGEDCRDSKHRYVASFSSLGHKQMVKRSLIGSKLRRMYRKQKLLHKKLFPWSYDWHRDQSHAVERIVKPSVVIRRCKSGPVDHDAVLQAMSRALEATEEAYMEMVENALDKNPELALMGSCVLVMLMKDQDVYVMNLGDSRVILAQDRLSDRHTNQNLGKDDMRYRNRSRESLVRVELDKISEESPMRNLNNQVCSINKNRELCLCRLKMIAVQLSTDHSTSIEQEILRIKAEHADDPQAVLNDRVKGQLKVTRAFGAGFLKKPKFNEALLEMFQIDYIGTSPYISCIPSVHHHRLGSNDRFLVLSSDGLYQYFSNEEVVAHVSWFMENELEGDPAQYLIAELLFRAAKKNGMDFHELLDIPHGDRRKYHDDVSVMVISLEGRIWRSSG